jgi:hypothetical protein
MRKILIPIILGASAASISYAANIKTKHTSTSTDALSFVQIMQDHNQNNKLKSSDTNTLVNTAIKNAYGALEINKMKINYENIRIKLIYDNNHHLDHLLVFKNKKLTKRFELDRIELSNNKLTNNYKLDITDHKTLAIKTAPVCPDTSITFVISSYNYSNDNRKIFSSPALDEIKRNATRAGFKVKTLYDDEATSQNIINYLSCPNVKAYHDTGDGDDNGWETFDGLVSDQDIQNDLNGKLNDKIIYLNDCLVFNNPLQQAMVSAGASAYMGGITELSVLTTDEAGACTWNAILENNTDVPLEKKSSVCQTAYDYMPFGSSDGITGVFNKSGYYLKVPKPISELAWGAIDEGDLGDGLEGSKFGSDMNIKNGNNETDSYTATTTAYNRCISEQGQSCDVPSNEISFKYCASMVYSKKPYFGYSHNKETAKKQAITACGFGNYNLEDDACQNTITTVCNI